MKNITNPKKISTKFLAVLPERSRDIVSRRFGLGEDLNKSTLESIGRDYGITRERVRQIENNALKNIRKSGVFVDQGDIFDYLKDLIFELGAILSEDELLEYLSKNEAEKNHFNFLLVLGDPFNREKGNSKFKTRWFIDKDLSSQVHNALEDLINEIQEDNLYQEDEIINLFIDKAGNIDNRYKKNNDVIKRWLSISKLIDKNHFDEWGLSTSSNINAKGIRDYAYLSIRQHGSPMHFREVAKSIEKNFNKKAHTATCHNELIRDPRFILVGRGLYALSEWGYVRGVVRDVIMNILKKEGPLTKEEIIERVLRERYIKENTVVVNLQDSNLFKKDTKGRYAIVV